jgi:hypothetical protein
MNDNAVDDLARRCASGLRRWWVAASCVCMWLGFGAGAAEASGTCGTTGTYSLVVSASGSVGSCTYMTTGEDTFAVPAGVSSVGVAAVGGRGAAGPGAVGPNSGGAGGFGASVVADLPVTSGTVLYVEVAGSGSAQGDGGSNGGGPGGTGGTSGGGGGGASDVRVSPSSAGLSPDPRLLVAGGGGGGGAEGGAGGNAGSAGSANLGLGGGGGGPGTSSGGSAGASGVQGEAGEAGSLGTGGAGGTCPGGASCDPVGEEGGGGGGGYYGGGGGGGGEVANGGGGGGGGSSFVLATATNTAFSTNSSGVPIVMISWLIDSPHASITKPVNAATYAVKQVVDSEFGCSEGAGGFAILSCVAQNGQTSGGEVDTSAAGPHTFVVTAASRDGESATSSVAYNVAAAPSGSVLTPASDATYTLHQAVDASFYCNDGAYGPGIASCEDQTGQRSGEAINTASTGSHTFTVTATSEDGQTSITRVSYRVEAGPASSAVLMRGLPSGKSGVVTFALYCVSSSAGCHVTASATTTETLDGGKLVAVSASATPHRRTLLVATKTSMLRADRTTSITLKLNAIGHKLLGKFNRLPIELTVIVVSGGGKSTTVASRRLTVQRPTPNTRRQ